MEKQAFMVCMRVDEIDDPGDSTTTACVECGSDIWINADSRKFAASKGAMPICAGCARKLASDDGIAVGIQEVRGQGAPINPELENLARELRENGAISHPDDIPGPVADWLRSQGIGERDIFENFKWAAKQAEKMMSRPDDDWGSMVVLEGYDGLVSPPVPIGDMMGSGIPKAVIAHQILPGIAHVAQARRVLIGLSSWSLTGKKSGELPEFEGSISEHPDRQEMLMMLDITGDGVQQMVYADIIRDGVNGPKLSEWKESGDPSKSEGLFVEAIIPTLALIKLLHEKNAS